MERIVLITPKLELRASTVYTLSLARELKLRGYRVFVMGGEGGFSKKLVTEKIPFIRADFSGNFLRDILYLNQYAKLLKEINPDILHVVHHNLAGIGGLLAKRIQSPWMITLQNPVKGALPCKGPWFRGAIAISQPVRQSAVNTGLIPREKVYIVENGVATGLNPPVRDSLGLIPVVGAVSRLQKDRGIKYFIHAANELIKRGVQAHFLVIDAGPEEKKIRKLIRATGMTEHITINMAAANYMHLMDPIDLFVSPTLSEGFGVFVLQAMAAAIPVVASASGGIFSLITDNETGLIVPKRDVSLFANKIQLFLEDRSFAERIGMNGFRHVQSQYPLKKTLEGTLKLYHQDEEVYEA